MRKFTVTVKRIYEVTETIETLDGNEALDKIEELFDELIIEGRKMYDYERTVEPTDQMSIFDKASQEEE